MITSTLFTVPFTAKALDSSGQIGDDVYYTFNGTTGVVIVYGTGNTYNYKCDYIWYNDTYSPFCNSNDVKSVVIGNGVTGIGDALFNFCSSLKSVTLSNTVKTIGTFSFEGCLIDYLVIPSSVESIAIEGVSDARIVEVRSYNCNLDKYAFAYVDEIKACEGSTAQANAQINNMTFTSIGHTWNDGVITTAPTCTKTGVKTYICTVCGETKDEDIEPLGHNYQSAVTAPSCTSQGYTIYTCTGCGRVYLDNIVPKTAHTWN